MTQYDFVMERVTLAILRVTDALITNDPFAIAQECAHARRDYEYVRRLYLKLQLQAAERDSVCGEFRVTQPRVADTSRGSEAATDTC